MRNWPLSEFYIRAPQPSWQIWKLMRFESIMVFITQSSSIGPRDNSAGVCKFDLFMGISQSASPAPSSFIHARAPCIFRNESFPNHWSLWIGWPSMYYARTHICVRVCISPASTTSHITFPYWKMMGKNDQRNEMHRGKSLWNETFLQGKIILHDFSHSEFHFFTIILHDLCHVQ